MAGTADVPEGTGSAEDGTGLTLAAFPRMLGLADLRTDIRYYLV
jgi:hypothetical protein